MTHHVRRGLLALIAACALVLLPAVGAAQAAASAPVAEREAIAPSDTNAFTFDSMSVDYRLTRDEDGTAQLRVVETLVARFPETDQNRGIRRDIPELYNGQPTNPKVISVTDENGNDRPWETDSEDDWLMVTSHADDYLHGAQTYVITYTVEHVTWFFPETDTTEFYWDVNGVGWQQPFGDVSATLHVAPDIAADLTGDAECYVGENDARDACPGIARTDEPDGSAVFTASSGPLQARQTLTVAVGFENGTFAPFDPSYFASPFGWLQAAVLALFGGAAAWGIVGRARNRDAPGRATVIAEYEPPPGMDAALSATFLQSPSAFTATLVDQAVRGAIRVLEPTKTSAWSTPETTVQLVDPALATPVGKVALENLFPNLTPGATFTFGEKANSALAEKATTDAQATAVALLKTRELRGKPARHAGVIVVLLTALAAGALVLGIIAAATHYSPVIPLTLGVVALVLAFLLAVLVTRRSYTAAGSETRDHLAGLKEFISWAEKDRIQMLQSPQGAERRPVNTDDPRAMLHLYERLLPYAIVFNQEKEWTKVLETRYESAGMAAPTWYAGTSAFSASALSSSISSLSSASSSSSSSGGSTGGGSAGGGGGGGGGGGV